jgi:hypothetical protein
MLDLHRTPHRVNKRSGTRSASRRGGLDDAAGVQKPFASLTRGDEVSGVRRPFEDGRLHRISASSPSVGVSAVLDRKACPEKPQDSSFGGTENMPMLSAAK